MAMITTKTELISKVGETGVTLKSKLLEKEQLSNKGTNEGYTPLLDSLIPNKYIPILNQDTTGNAATATKILAETPVGTSVELIRARMGGDDLFRFLVGDDGNDPIYVRQYTGNANNTWASIVRSLTLLDESGNTVLPGTISATAFNNTSDKRLKTNIQKALPSSKLIDDINVVSFDRYEGESSSYGVIAQELYEIFPEAVQKGDDGELIVEPWLVDYTKLIMPLLLEVQSLRKRVKSLEDSLTELESIKERISILESK